jgi:hypothetical protein
MPVVREQWKQLYAVFNPAQRLELADAALFVERPGAVADEIAADLELETAGKWIVCGSMGSGKSSELAHLGGLLQRNDYAVVGLDLPNTVAAIEKLQPAEVLFLIGLAAIRAASDLWDHAISEAATRRLVDALTLLLAPNFALQPSEIVQGVALFVGDSASAGGAVKKRLPQRPSPLSGVTRPVQEGEPDLVRLQEAVDGVLDELAEVGKPIVLVDGLDKIQELTSIRRMFSAGRILALPRRPIVYTGPITLMLATEWQAAGGQFERKRLTNIAVRRPQLDGVEVADAKLRAGRTALREVVERRLAHVGLAPADVFADDSIDLLIDVSGGVLRNMIFIVRSAIGIAFRHRQPLLDRALAEEAVSDWRKEYEITMNTRRRHELEHVLAHGEPSGEDASLELLLGGYILPYANGKVWFEPHPVLRDGLARGP